jgi:hypothetical protein
MNAQVNVPRILQGMKKQGWGVAAAAVNCGVNNKTLGKILKGEIPQRLDAFYRVIDGLGIPIQEAVINGGAHKTARLHVVSDRRREADFAENK